jgi:glycosyltransferase involved in cell wall biosynthesis
VQLDIILRTHDQGSLHGRDFDKPKKEITQRCVNSLLKAIVDDVDLIIVDDHSSPETLALLGKVVTLKDTGNNASLVKTFELAADSKADAVYLVEDDYLHYPHAISEAMETFEYFQKMTGKKDICLNLVDCPANYHRDGYVGGGRGRDGSSAMIVGGINRAWRTNTHTGGTFMTTPGVINKYWGAFDDLAQNWPEVDENTTWNKVWESHVPLFTPLIPLAYHLSEIHPYYPFDKLWRQNKCTRTLKMAS